MSAVEEMPVFCLSDQDYYDAPERLDDAASRYPLDEQPVPTGWRRTRRGLWTHLHPEGERLPEQGWKIHVSATPGRAGDVLATVASICLPRRVSFKFIRSADGLKVINGKYMNRASSGKFITVYAPDDNELATLLDLLVAALDGSPGPYILSDLRIGAGPVFVRYGAFTAQWCERADGARVPALRDNTGALVPDERRPVFRLPAWLSPPDVLRPHLAAREAAGAPDFPYRVLHPLHFTAGGGTYLAEHKQTRQRVVLREARPHAGLDGAGSDAVTRLHREYETLTQLAGLPFVPRVYGLRTVWEHEFLIEEHVEGQSLLEAIITTNPMRKLAPSPASIRDYLDWTTKISDSLSQALTALHDRGISFGDLHPQNIIVRPDGRVTLIDFEYAGVANGRRQVRAAAAGFGAPGRLTGAEADRYALRAVWLMMLLVMSELTERDRGKMATLEAVARQLFGLGPDAGPPLPAALRTAEATRRTGEDIVTALFNGPEVDWAGIRERLTEGINNAASPERPDRLFPGDPRVFAEQPASLAYGAGGVLLALNRSGADVAPEHLDWLVTSARREPPRPGLFNGGHGVAAALDELGRREEACELLARCEAAGTVPGRDLYSGLAGVGLIQCRFGVATFDAALIDSAADAALRLDADLRDGNADAMPAGLLHGMSGPALLDVQLYRITGDRRFLAAARRALQRDISHCVTVDDGTVQVKSGHRHLLYLDGGSGGIALVAAEYLTHADDCELSAFIQAVRPGCAHRLMREPGLFQGRAGILAMLARLCDPGSADAATTGSGAATEAVLAQARRLAWHAVARDDALLIPGRRLLRFSADLGTGSAGVLLALHSVFDGPADPLGLMIPGLRPAALATPAQ